LSHRDNRTKLGVSGSRQETTNGSRVLIDRPREISLRHLVLRAERVQLVDDVVYRADLTPLPLKLGPKLRVLSQASREALIVVASVPSLGSSIG
jgi:hypothetical protein